MCGAGSPESQFHSYVCPPALSVPSILVRSDGSLLVKALLDLSHAVFVQYLLSFFSRGCEACTAPYFFFPAFDVMDFYSRALLEYFIYKAGPGRPALHLLPGPFPRLLTDSDIALLPHDDGAHFVLAVPTFTFEPWVYDLHIFSSRTWSWTRKVAQAEVSSVVRNSVSTITAFKVLQFGGGTVGWVHLREGIMVCNVLDETPVLRFIPLPPMMPGHTKDSNSLWQMRDVSCSNGLIRFVEVERHERRDADERSLDDMDTLYDSDCLPKPKEIGWRAMTWYRMISSDHWRKGCMVYDKEISVDCQRHSMLIPKPTDNNAGELTLKNLLASFPALSLIQVSQYNSLQVWVGLSRPQQRMKIELVLGCYMLFMYLMNKYNFYYIFSCLERWK